MAEIAVRPAMPEDAALVLALIRKLAAFEEPGASIDLTEDIIRAEAFGERRHLEILLAEWKGRAVGLVVLVPTFSSWRGSPALLVHDLFVEEEARARGAGTALLAAVARLARDRGCCRLDVNVLARNDKGRKFYESLGFVPLADWIPHRLSGEDLVRLSRHDPDGSHR